MDATNLDWLMTKVRDGVVGLGAGWRYHVTVKAVGNGPETVVDCDDAVYALEAAGLVYLEPEGPVSHTKEGRRQLEAAQRDRVAEPAAAKTAARRGRRTAERYAQVAA